MIYFRNKIIKCLFFTLLFGTYQVALFSQKDQLNALELWDTTEVRNFIETGNFNAQQKYLLWEFQKTKAQSSNHPTTSFYYLKEMEAVPKSFDSKEIVVKYTRYSVYATNRYILDNALSYAYQAEDIAENANDDFMRGRVNHALGWYYAANCDYVRAHRTYDKAIGNFKSVDYVVGIRNTLVKKAIAYQLQGKNKRALKIYNEVYNLENRTPTENDIFLLLKSTYLSKDMARTLQLLKEYFDMVENKNPHGPYTHHYYHIKSIEASIKGDEFLEGHYLHESEKIARKINLPKEHFSALINLGKFFLKKGKLKIAKQKFKRANAIAYKELMHNRFKEPTMYLLEIAYLQGEGIDRRENEAILENYFKETQQKINVNNIIENNQKSILIRQKREIQTQNQKIWILTTLGFMGLGMLLFSFFYFRKYKKIVQDISEKNTLLDEAVHEKQTLLQETHHRVKNNLQIIASLLNLQRKYTKDSKLTAALIDGRNRVKSMALIHQLLYQKKELKGINVRNYVENLMSSLFSSLKANVESIHFINKVDPLNLHEDTLLSIGLIINEIVTNSLKYAFQNRHDGTIIITLIKKTDRLFLSVSDNGNGMPDDFDINDKSSFGYSLITSLSKKLDAKISILNDNGTTVNLDILKFVET